MDEDEDVADEDSDVAYEDAVDEDTRGTKRGADNASLLILTRRFDPRFTTHSNSSFYTSLGLRPRLARRILRQNLRQVHPPQPRRRQSPPTVLPQQDHPQQGRERLKRDERVQGFFRRGLPVGLQRI